MVTRLFHGVLFLALISGGQACLRNTADPETVREAAPTCSKLKDIYPDALDGEYCLSLKMPDGSFVTKIYCQGMDTGSPQEYLTLGQKVNTFIMNSFYSSQESFVNQYSGMSAYSRIKINVTDMEVDPMDFTFSTRLGINDVPFGKAGDCMATNKKGKKDAFRTIGVVALDLNDTDFHLHPSVDWVGYGKTPKKDVTISEDRKQVQGMCGGMCGGCQPQVSEEGSLSIILEPDEDKGVSCDPLDNGVIVEDYMCIIE